MSWFPRIYSTLKFHIVTYIALKARLSKMNVITQASQPTSTAYFPMYPQHQSTQSLGISTVLRRHRCFVQTQRGADPTDARCPARRHHRWWVSCSWHISSSWWHSWSVDRWIGRLMGNMIVTVTPQTHTQKNTIFEKSVFLKNTENWRKNCHETSE